VADEQLYTNRDENFYAESHPGIGSGQVVPNKKNKKSYLIRATFFNQWQKIIVVYICTLIFKNFKIKQTEYEKIQSRCALRRRIGSFI